VQSSGRQLTEEELEVDSLVRALKQFKSEPESSASTQKATPGSPDLLGKIRHDKRKHKATEAGSLVSKYVNLRFVLGSAAGIECVRKVHSVSAVSLHCSHHL
jgi:hypothetical protein